MIDAPPALAFWVGKVCQQPNRLSLRHPTLIFHVKACLQVNPCHIFLSVDQVYLGEIYGR